MNELADAVQPGSRSIPLNGAVDPLRSVIAFVEFVGTGLGQLRRLTTLVGKEVIERLEAIDEAKRWYRYALVAGVSASIYTGTIEVKPKGAGCVASWRVQFLAANQPDIAVRAMVAGLVNAGLENLKARFSVVREHKLEA